MDLILKAKEEIEKKLDVFNDPNFKFIEDKHKYLYLLEDDKYDEYTSVTTYIKRFKKPYDQNYWAKKKSNELGIEPNELLDRWKAKADNANKLGTNVHKWIEDFWSGKAPEIPEDVNIKDRVNKFMEMYNKRLNNLFPLQSELKIFSKKWKLAGTIDQPFLFFDYKLNKPLLLIGDWKTNEDFKDDNHPKGRYNKLLSPFTHLYENHHNEYSIQISLYRLILEEYGIETHDGFLCHLGPNTKPRLYKTLDLRELLKIYLNQ